MTCDLLDLPVLSVQDRMHNPIAFLAEICGNVMYFAQSICQPSGKQFVEAIVKQVNGHVENGNWHLIKRSEVRDGKPCHHQSMGVVVINSILLHASM